MLKIQHLTVIFIIIILPILMIISAYINSQVNTLNLESQYDERLLKATSDALQAFQTNTLSSDSSDLANSKIRDIEASVNSFFDSISINFNMVRI